MKFGMFHTCVSSLRLKMPRLCNKHGRSARITILVLLFVGGVSYLSAYDIRSPQLTVRATQDDEHVSSMVKIASMVGEVSGDFFGRSVSGAGDVNGDGYDDVIVGAPYNDAGGEYDDDRGQAYIYYGGRAVDRTIDITFTGEASDDWFGYSVSGVGDMNNDGYDDVIVGAPYNDAGGEDAGRAYIYFGGEAMNTAPDATLTGENQNNLFGHSVSGAGDVNSDGYGDVIIGAYLSCAGGRSAGRAYIYFGGNSMDNTRDVTLTGETHNYEFGYSVSGAADVNGDGYSDVIVGAPGYDNYKGRAYIFYGGSAMDNKPDVTLTGKATGDGFGGSVSAAGDVNGDGYDDVVVSRYIFYGKSSLQSSLSTSDANVVLIGGVKRGAGDVNGDGYSDVIVGVSGENQAYIYCGGWAMDTAPDPDVTLTGEASGDGFGGSVSAAGDVNGDGYDDVIVGADRNDAGGENAGKAYIYTLLRIDVSTPSVTYDNSSQTIDITGVTAVCTHPDPTHGELDDNEATIHTYSVYTRGGSPTAITGDLVWTGHVWHVLDVDVSALPAGEYYVQCYFEDIDVTGTSPASNTFTIGDGGEGEPQPQFVFLADTRYLLGVIGVAAVVGIVIGVIVVLKRRRP